MKTLKSERIVYRPFNIEDAEIKYRLDSDPDVIKFMGGYSDKELSKRRLEALILRYDETEYGHRAICKIESSAVVGLCGLQLTESGDTEVIVALLPEYRGDGLGIEAVEFLITFGLALPRVTRIIGRVDTENRNSLKLVNKLGMKCIGTAYNIYIEKDEYIYEASR